MKLTYVAYSRLDLESANSIQTFNTCRALAAKLGGDLTALVPQTGSKGQSAPFQVVRIPRVPINKLSRVIRSALWSYLERTVYAWIAVMYLLFHRADIVYVRDIICAFWLVTFRAPVVYEVHDLESRHPSQMKSPRLSRWLKRIDERTLLGARAVVSLTNAFRDEAVQSGWQPAEKLFVIPDAYDEATYYPRSRAEMRGRLGLKDDDLVIGYAGLTFAYRRIDLLLATLAAWDNPRVLALIIGGRPFEVAELKQQAYQLGLGSRVIWRERENPEATAQDLSAADILVIPDTVTDVTASPLKMFEYMALGRAIVAVDRPALREILTPGTAEFFRAGDAQDLARALRLATSSEEVRQAMGTRALACVREYTYALRAERIIRACDQVRGGGQA